jgi:hypothetical protein
MMPELLLLLVVVMVVVVVVEVVLLLLCNFDIQCSNFRKMEDT